uniref:WW domain-containing protein n=1 Tax=viral metagenome TaxID=1070528 RepID=A0A6C0B7G1_9ZZZZ
MSEKRQYSPSPTKESIPLVKKHKEESSPPKTIKVLLRELGFLQKWEKITEANKSSRFYYNRRTGKSMYTTPYQDIEKQQYSGTIIPQFLETHGPDRTIDYLIELLESYIFHVYEKEKKRRSIRDILRFDVLGFGHGGKKTAKSNSIKPEDMPNSITFCMPSNIIGTTGHLNPSMDYTHTQYSKNKSLSRSEKTELRDTISQRYETRKYKCNYDISEIQIAIQKIIKLSQKKGSRFPRIKHNYKKHDSQTYRRMVFERMG